MPIVVEKLNYIYLSGSNLARHALEDVSFQVEEGEFLSVIGHTGSGKSTLIQHLNGLVQPTSGYVNVDGLDPAQKADRPKIRRLVGMVFQYPEYQLFEETVAADIAFGPRNLGVAEAELEERIRESMELVGLDYQRFAHKSPFDLSGGEKRRVALAGVIAMRPKYLVLDEPMAGLDPRGRNNVLSTIRKLRETTGCAIIMVSHSMDDVARESRRILVLNHGRVAMLAPPEEIFAQAEILERMGLDLPESAKLALALKRRGVSVPAGLYREDQLLAYLEGRLIHV